MVINLTYSGDSIHIDAESGIDCIVSEKEGYVETVCTDSTGTTTSKLYYDKDDAINNCEPASS